jgi:hypothetical protein
MSVGRRWRCALAGLALSVALAGCQRYPGPLQVELVDGDGVDTASSDHGTDGFEEVFADHPVRRCVAGEDGWAVRDVTGWTDPVTAPQRSRVEAGVDLRDGRALLDEHAVVAFTSATPELIEVGLVRPTREALDVIAGLTDPRRVCIHPLEHEGELLDVG